MSAFFVADISRRGTDQTADVVFFHVLGHVDLHQGVGVAEQAFGQSFGQQGLTDPGRAGEDEATGWTLRILSIRYDLTDGLGNGGHGLFLLTTRLCSSASIPISGRNLRSTIASTNTGHLADDFGDNFFVDDTVGFHGSCRASRE